MSERDKLVLNTSSLSGFHLALHVTERFTKNLSLILSGVIIFLFTQQFTSNRKYKYAFHSGKLLGSLSKALRGTDRVGRLSFGGIHVQMLSAAALWG